jgi:hypothetical protein
LGAAGTPFPAAFILQGIEEFAHIKSLVSANGVAETPIVSFKTVSSIPDGSRNNNIDRF